MPDPFFQPVSGIDSPRFAGVPTFMRLPHVELDDSRIADVDVGLVGIPFDSGTTNRPGARHGPRQLRDQSTMIRMSHPVTRTNPFELVNCADLGDVNPNPVSIEDTFERITAFYRRLASQGIRPLSFGGDHSLSFPVLQGIVDKGNPVGMIHFDAHTDLFDGYFGDFKLTHGTPFRRAVEAGVLDPERVVQIGIRGTAYGFDDIEWAEEHGVRIIRIEEFMDRGIEDVMTEARRIVGSAETYISFDIDFIDPAFAPGTGTPEIGGPDTYTAQRCVRLLDGVNIIGADVVEVSPPLDPSGATAWVGVSIAFEILCVLARSLEARKSGA
ncbi:agmatinase [Hoeflea poritis]|uniref:Agmatinase n=1 Tax=Hoeflea poritis TaxID=2993659 RepID=A0ABT4VIR4_9HYPH|nr:agmatinase [Hoeflea poritis]MDA4844609.1 agmatinase [Hoeflea poritis]